MLALNDITTLLGLEHTVSVGPDSFQAKDFLFSDFYKRIQLLQNTFKP